MGFISFICEQIASLFINEIWNKVKNLFRDKKLQFDIQVIYETGIPKPKHRIIITNKNSFTLYNVKITYSKDLFLTFWDNEIDKLYKDGQVIVKFSRQSCYPKNGYLYISWTMDKDGYKKMEYKCNISF